MKGYDAYKKYVAIKLHFQTNYDYFKFAGKAKASRESFETRRDRHIFDRLAKVYDAEQYELLLVANFLDGTDAWIGNIAAEQGRQKYLQLKRRLQSLQYEFRQNMEKIKDDIDTGVVKSFDAIFTATTDEDSSWPYIVDLLTQQDITLESFIIMNKVLNFLPRLSSKIKEDLVWPEIHKLITKYSPFVRVDLKPFRQIMKDVFLPLEQKSLAARE
jgi:T4 gene Gp59 loader of gp41 DNA helicase/T4 gene Gp59 loader of gp41 DNA helicase C-term